MSESGQQPALTAKEAWQSPEKAAAYRSSREPSHFHRFQREERIINDWLEGLPQNALVLDIPCGTGRMIPTLLSHQFRYIGGDFSLAMIGEARRTAADAPAVKGFVNADAERLPFANDSVDCVILWRFLHHVGETAVRQAILHEAARVARDRVLVSFHHPISFTHWRKLFQRKFLGYQKGVNAVSHRQLEREASSGGLRLLETRGFRKYVSVNWFARFEKRDAPPT